jgi:hypothetical protein
MSLGYGEAVPLHPRKQNSSLGFWVSFVKIWNHEGPNTYGNRYDAWHVLGEFDLKKVATSGVHPQNERYRRNNDRNNLDRLTSLSCANGTNEDNYDEANSSPNAKPAGGSLLEGNIQGEYFCWN